MTHNSRLKSPDRFLIFIVAGILLLVAAAFVITLNRQPPSYQDDSLPQGAAHNYLLALVQGDFERAYGYLSPKLAGLPKSASAFERSVRESPWYFNLDASSVALSVLSSEVQDDHATVTVNKTIFHQNGLFDSSTRSQQFKIELERQDGAWKISTGTDYFLRCWQDKKGCQ